MIQASINPYTYKKWFIGYIAILLVVACKKDSTGNSPNSPISIIPVVSIDSLTPTSIHALTDSLHFRIHYTDGDGDLGNTNADSMSLFIVDNRFPLTFGYHVPPLAPLNTAVTISGILKVTLGHIILKDSASSSEKATFSVYMRDRAGHVSNLATSSAITINR